jgi:hypothetical protein
VYLNFKEACKYLKITRDKLRYEIAKIQNNHLYLKVEMQNGKKINLIKLDLVYRIEENLQIEQDNSISTDDITQYENIYYQLVEKFEKLIETLGENNQSKILKKIKTKKTDNWVYMKVLDGFIMNKVIRKYQETNDINSLKNIKEYQKKKFRDIVYNQYYNKSSKAEIILCIKVVDKMMRDVDSGDYEKW